MSSYITIRYLKDLARIYEQDAKARSSRSSKFYENRTNSLRAHIAELEKENEEKFDKLSGLFKSNEWRRTE